MRIRKSINLNTIYLFMVIFILCNYIQNKTIDTQFEKQNKIIAQQEEILNEYKLYLEQNVENKETEEEIKTTNYVELDLVSKDATEPSNEPNNQKEKSIEDASLPTRLTQHTDLMTFEPIGVDKMNNIISDFNNIISKSEYECPFVGRGDVFIKASEESGLNPLYIFAHACLESDYGRSVMARTKGNYFGIAAFDHNPSNAYYIGDSLEDGIVNGAIWIRDNFYYNNQTTLYEMQYKYSNHRYASNGQKWIDDIVWIANKYV